METMRRVLEYLELGWSVIPIPPNRKESTIKWKEFQTRRMTPEEAQVLFKPGDNIALICGDISGVLVIDQDDYKKKSGLEVDSPVKVTTPRGGTHLYFKYKEGTGNTANANLATDIRSRGGYVLLPESTVIYDNGQKGSYTWNRFPTKEALESLPVVPQEILNKIYQSSGSVSTPFNPLNSFNIEEGGRNDALHKLAISLLSKHDEKHAWMMVIAANNTYSPPLSESEVKTLFNSARNFVSVSPPIKRSTVVESNDNQKIPTIKENYHRAIDIFVSGRQTGIPTGFEKLDKITGGLIPGQSYLLFADTNVGKSIFAVNILVDLAKRGIKTVYFDLENSIETSMERMMFATSSGELELDEWKEIKEHNDEEGIRRSMSVLEPILPNLFVWDLNSLDDRFGEITWPNVNKCITESIAQGVQVVVIDHLHYFAPSETDHSVLGEVARQLNNLAAIHKIAVVLVAHTKKGLTFPTKAGKVLVVRPTLDSINGSSLISKHFKNVIALKRNVASSDEEERCETVVYVDKTKSGPSGQFRLNYNEETLCFLDPSIPKPMSKLKKQRLGEEVLSYLK